MHPYATDSSERRVIPFFLAVFGILAAYGLGWIIQKANLTSLWWVDMPAVAGFYGLFYKAFDKWLWRIPILRKIGLIKVPNLNGEWRAQFASSYDQHGLERQATVCIVQTWTQIIISLRTETSRSRSLTAMIAVEDPTAPAVSYDYFNEPRSHAVETMIPHRGTAFLTFLKESNTELLEGDYYGGRGRLNTGVIRMKKCK